LYVFKGVQEGFAVYKFFESHFIVRLVFFQFLQN